MANSKRGWWMYALDFMDEEERRETWFQMALQTSFHRMVYGPEVEEQLGTNVLPSGILLGNPCWGIRRT